MAERPIIFGGPMIRSILGDLKTQTRRVLKHQPAGDEWRGATGTLHSRGTVLWVREAWRVHAEHDATKAADIPPGSDIQYPADQLISFWDSRYRSALHMPRWASRITLRVTDVRVQRLRDITEADAVAEGIEPLRSGRGYYDPTFSHGAVRLGHYCIDAATAFRALWDSLNAKRGHAWASNPWVVAYTFERIAP